MLLLLHEKLHVNQSLMGLVTLVSRAKTMLHAKLSVSPEKCMRLSRIFFACEDSQLEQCLWRRAVD